jgi:hypothetical protein
VYLFVTVGNGSEEVLANFLEPSSRRRRRRRKREV